MLRNLLAAKSVLERMHRGRFHEFSLRHFASLRLCVVPLTFKGSPWDMGAGNKARDGIVEAHRQEQSLP